MVVVAGYDHVLTLIAGALQKFFSTDKQDCKQDNGSERHQMNRLCQVMQDAMRIGSLFCSMTGVSENLWATDESDQANQSKLESIHFKKSF